jgi:hypothetical protein
LFGHLYRLQYCHAFLIRLELIGNLMMFFVALFAVIQRNDVEPGLVGLALSNAFTVTIVCGRRYYRNNNTKNHNKSNENNGIG